MRKISFYLLIAPLFIATTCDDDDNDCRSYEDFEGYIINVENTQSIYDVNEMIWFEATASSMLANECDSNEIDIVTDVELFLESLFVLKLVNTDSDINSEITNASVVYDIGTEFNFDSCSNAVSIEPVSVSSGEEYKYRVGFSFDAPGDYCVTIGRHVLATINNSNDVNLEIYESYNNLENTVKFDNCNTTYTREIDSGVYFFSIQ